MTDPLGTAATLGTAAAAGGAFVMAFLNRRKADVAASKAADAKLAAEQSQREIVIVGDRIVAVGEQLDGRLSELLKEARALARAEGVAAGEQAQRDRHAPADPS